LGEDNETDSDPDDNTSAHRLPNYPHLYRIVYKKSSSLAHCFNGEQYPDEEDGRILGNYHSTLQ